MKLHSFVSLSREFSKYIKTFAAGFTLVQTVLHDVFAGVQLETIWFKIESVCEVKIKFSKISGKTEHVSRLNKLLFLTLGKYCLSLFEKAILTFVSSCHFPQCGNAMFLFETFFVCFLIFEIELKPARFIDSSVSSRIFRYSEIFDAGLTYIYNI